MTRAHLPYSWCRRRKQHHPIVVRWHHHSHLLSKHYWMHGRHPLFMIRRRCFVPSYQNRGSEMWRYATSMWEHQPNAFQMNCCSAVNSKLVCRGKLYHIYERQMRWITGVALILMPTPTCQVYGSKLEDFHNLPQNRDCVELKENMMKTCNN